MKDMRGREVRYQVVTNCGECVHCCFDICDECYRCTRHGGEPKVDPLGEPPEWCFLLSDRDILTNFVSFDEADRLIKEEEEKHMRFVKSHRMDEEESD